MSVDELPSVLQVEETSEGRYRVNHPAEDPEARNVVFSGQIMAQMIMASDHAVEGTKEVKSIHAIFARAGRYTESMELQRESLHAGRAWGSETFTAYQGDRLLSRGLVLLNTDEPDLIRHASGLPEVPRPDALTTDPGSFVYPDTEIRTFDDPKATAADGSPALHFWLRHARSFDSVAVNQAILAWCEPGLLIALSMRPHGDTVNIGDAHHTVSTGVIAHTAHFHERFDVGEWLLVSQQSSYAGRGRVHGSGSVFTEDGRLVATFSQDSMVRGVEHSLDPKRSM
ncbi:MAG: thioesterase family protein [Myxococcales bacterium]|nr:thioesterase family protein [Myxococcales bacterium]